MEKPTFIFGDNRSVLVNSSKPHSSLKKKSSSIAFHFVREGVAKDEWRVAYLNTKIKRKFTFWLFFCKFHILAYFELTFSFGV